MKKFFLTTTLCTIIIASPAFTTTIASAFETTAVIPRFELMTPGVTRYFTITQFNDYPQDFSFFLIMVIGYGPLSITLTSPDATEGDLLVISGVGISPAGIQPFLKFGRANVTLQVVPEIGTERNPYGIVWFSTRIASPLEEETSYGLEIAF